MEMYSIKSFHKKILDMQESIRLYRRDLGRFPASFAYQEWLKTLTAPTAAKYNSYMKELEMKGILKIGDITLDVWFLINANSIRAAIKKLDISENARYARRECFESFRKYISFIFFDKRSHLAYAEKVQVKKIRDMPAFHEFKDFIECLALRYKKECLVALTMYYCRAKISSVLALKYTDVDWVSNAISFKIGKKHPRVKKVIVPKFLLTYINAYSERSVDSEAFLFVTRENNPITRSRINFVFHKCNETTEALSPIYPDLLHVLGKFWIDHEEYGPKFEKLCENMFGPEDIK